MWHPHPHISSGIDGCGDRTLNIPKRVVQQHLVVADVNAEVEGMPRVSTVKGRSQWIFSRRRSLRIGMHKFCDLRASKKEIGIRAGLVGRAGRLRSVTGDNTATPTRVGSTGAASPVTCDASTSARLPQRSLP